MRRGQAAHANALKRSLEVLANLVPLFHLRLLLVRHVVTVKIFLPAEQSLKGLLLFLLVRNVAKQDDQVPERP